MLCSRCSHPLHPRADRCLRCFALNPQNRGAEPLAPVAPPARRRPEAPDAPAAFREETAAAPVGLEDESLQVAVEFQDETPAEPVDLEDEAPAEPVDLDDEAPAEPVARRDGVPAPDDRLDRGRLEFRIDSDPQASYRATLDGDEPAFATAARLRSPRPQLHLSFGPDESPAPEVFAAPAGAAEARTEPPEAAVEDSSPVRGKMPARAVACAALPGPSRAARIAAWGVDATALAMGFALHVGIAALLVGPQRISPGGPQSLDTWADLLLFARALPLLWGLLAACLSLAYSWAFVAVAGRTPGMLLAGLRVVRLRRGAPGHVSAARALARSLLAFPSLLCGAFGFVLALFDARGQALHDRLAGCRVVAAGSLRTRGLRG